MDSMTSEKNGALSVWSCGGCQMGRGSSSKSKQGSDLGYACQTRAEPGELWPPRRFDKTSKLGNNI
jgi:hypothetical protein